jgi:hypothetical protein
VNGQLQLEATGALCAHEPDKIARGKDIDGEPFEFCCCDNCTEGKEIAARLKREPILAEIQRLPSFNAHLSEQAIDQETNQAVSGGSK